MTKKLSILSIFVSIIALFMAFMIPTTYCLANETRTVTLYDSSTMASGLTSAFDKNVDMTVYGYSTSTKSLSNVVVNNKEYKLCAPSGGNSSTSKYILFEIDYDFTMYVVGASNSSTKTYVALGSEPKYTTNDTVIATYETANEYIGATSPVMEAGAYYLTFNSAVNLCEITVAEYIDPTTTPNENTSSKTPSMSVEDNTQTGTGADENASVENGENSDLSTDSPTFDAKKTIKILIGTALGLTLVFVIIMICLKVFKKKPNDDYEDYDDYDDYDDWDSWE